MMMMNYKQFSRYPSDNCWDDLDIPLEVLEKMPSYYQAPANCPLPVHQSIMRQLYHCKRVIKNADFSINFY